MADEHQDSPEQQPAKLSESSMPSVDNNINKVKEEDTKTTNTSENHKTKCNSPQPFFVKIEKNKGWSRPEIISGVAAGLSFIAIVMMVLTFNKTRKAVGISETSLNDARRKDSITDKRFEIENVPYLQISIVNMVTLVPNQTLHLRFLVSNLNRYPAKITKGNTGFYLGTDSAAKPFTKPPQNGTLIENPSMNGYIIKESPQLIDFVGDKLFSKDKITEVNSGKYFIYFFGEIFYVDLVTQKNRKYVFHSRLYPTNPITYKMLENDNSFVK
jgi:hypothetical protein